MTDRMLRSTFLVAFVGVVMAFPAFAAQGALHAGTIVSENTERATITIEEMGPWHGPNTRLVRREFHLTPRTTVHLVARKYEPGGYQGAFGDQPLKATDLRPGDYATVTVERLGGKTVATKIEIIRPDMAPIRAESHVLKIATSAVR